MEEVQWAERNVRLFKSVSLLKKTASEEDPLKQR